MRWTLALLFVLLLSAIISFTDTASAFARRWTSVSPIESKLQIARADSDQHGHAHTTSTPPKLSVAVDGATNPTAISDDLAYEHLLKALAYRVAAPSRDAALKLAGLLPSDRAVLWREIETLQVALESVKTKGRLGAQLKVTQGETERAIGAARSRLRGALSPDGLARLDAYVREHVKRRIVLYHG